MGDTFNMSGDFRGSNINIKSTLHNVSQTVNTLPHSDQATRDELQRLIEQLNRTLQQAPADKTEEAEAVAQTAKNLVETATQETPKKTMVQISAEGLKKAAENLAAVLPAVLPIATKIAEIISQHIR